MKSGRLVLTSAELGLDVRLGHETQDQAGLLVDGLLQSLHHSSKSVALSVELSCKDGLPGTSVSEGSNHMRVMQTCIWSF